MNRYFKEKEKYASVYENIKASELYKFRSKIQVKSNAAKNKCKELANYTCACCGKKGTNDIDAHHIKPVTENSINDSQDNLICLCRSCHEKVHKGTYIIDPVTKKITVSEKFISETRPKAQYILDFEKKYDCIVTLKTSGCFIVKNNEIIKTKTNMIKAAVNAQSKYLIRKLLKETNNETKSA